MRWKSNSYITKLIKAHIKLFPSSSTETIPVTRNYMVLKHIRLWSPSLLSKTGWFYPNPNPLSSQKYCPQSSSRKWVHPGLSPTCWKLFLRPQYWSHGQRPPSPWLSVSLHPSHCVPSSPILSATLLVMNCILDSPKGLSSALICEYRGWISPGPCSAPGLAIRCLSTPPHLGLFCSSSCSQYLKRSLEDSA